MGAAPILTILKDGETVRSVPIEDEALLGRDEGCVIRLEGRMISREHALFRRKGDQVQVERKSEFAPLLVNGSDCTLAVLKEGDVIAIGPYLMKLSLQQQSASPAARVEAQAQDASPPTIAADAEILPESELQPMSLDPLPLEAPAEIRHEGTLELDGIGVAPEPEQVLQAPESLPETGSVMPLSESALTLEPPEAFAPGPEAGDQTRVVIATGLELKLIFKPGDANVLDYRLEKDEISIGRGKDCDIVLTDKKVSRKNTVISRTGANVTIKDLGSSNGTYVNGRKITEGPLSGGDKVKIGDAEFEFRADQPGYAEQEKGFLEVPPLSETSGPMELPAFQMDARAMPMSIPQADSAPAFDPNAPIVGVEGLAGIAGASTGKRKGFMERFRALPKRRQWIVIGLVIAFGYFFFLEEDDTTAPNPKQVQANKKAKKKKPVDGVAEADKKVAGKGTRQFSGLTQERQDFVRTQHKLAFEYFQHQDYANSLAAIKPIFEYVDDYEDSREILRYAEDGLRQMKIIAEEKAKKEAEDAKARRLVELLNKARGHMEKNRYEDASSVFNEILVIDPENAQVTQWQAKIRDHEEDLKVQAQKKQVQAEVSNQAWAVYKEGVALRRRGQLRKAIGVLSKVKEIGATDARPVRFAAEQIKGIREEIQAHLEPLLKEGKEKEDSQDFPGAIAAYDKALGFEPSSSEAAKGVGRIKNILNERAKALYTEAVLAESYSDFAVAKKKFQQCSETAPKDSLYHERAVRKLARYFKQHDDSAPAGTQ